MKYLNLTTILFITSTISMAQPWSLVRSDKHPVFIGPSITYPPTSNGWGGVPDSRVYDFSYDSVKLISGTDSVFYFKKEVEPFFNQTICGPFNTGINLLSSSWMGDYAVCKPGGVEFFFNQASDTIVLQPAAGIGTIWTMYRYANGDYIEATVAQIVAQTILNTADSLKIINLLAKTAGGQLITTNLWTGRQIRLSRTFGPDYIFGAWRFPQDTVSVKLVGEQNNKLGTSLLTVEEIYDYTVGDEFHYHYQYGPLMFAWGFYRQSKLTVLSKSINQDTLKYVYLRVGKNSVPNQNPATNFYFYSDTFTEMFELSKLQYLSNADLQIDNNPNLDSSMTFFKWYSLQSLDSNSANYFPHPINLNQRQIKYDVGPFGYSVGSSCGTFVIDHTGQNNLYAKGLGLVYKTMFAIGGAQNYNQLVYYKKGNEVSGTPLVMATVDQTIQSKIPMAFYPQPAKSGQLLHADLPEQLMASSLVIFDIKGREIAVVQPVSSQSNAWRLPSLAPGIYVFQLNNIDNVIIHRGKLLIETDY